MPDLLRRDFTADRPWVMFVSDITYIHIWQGFVRLATALKNERVYRTVYATKSQARSAVELPWVLLRGVRQKAADPDPG
jgi:transposase InsO family protein